jgi:hypothetical protein
MATSGKTTAVHFSLIVFVVTTLILGVTTFLFHKDRAAALATADARKRESTKADAARQKAYDEMQEVKKLIGHEFEEIGLKDTETPNSVLAAMRADIVNHGGGSAQGTVTDTLLKLSQTNTTVSEERNGLQNDLNDQKREVQVLRERLQKDVDLAKEKQAEAEADRLTVISTRDEAIAAKESKIADLESTNRQLGQELQEEIDARRNETQQLSDEISDLVVKNTRLQEELDEATNLTWEVADGKVRWVDHGRRLVWLDLGEVDRLRKRTSFSVYEKNHQGVGGGPEDIKGAIEVTRIIGPHMAEARIVDDDIFRPITQGDPIYTPLWSAGQELRFSFVGFVDLDGDSRSDREQLHDLVAAAGATIDNEVDDDGVLHGEGIDVFTKFLVIAEIKGLEDALPSQIDPRQATMQHLIELRSQARRQGVRAVSLSHFLDYIGYRATRRLWMPGTTDEYTIKGGSRLPGRPSDVVDPSATQRLPQLGNSKFRKRLDQRPLPDSRFNNPTSGY